MGRTIHKLTARQVTSLATPGYYADGGNLYLQIAKGGSKSWIIRYSFAGRKRDYGAGSVRDVPLARAREKAVAVRALLSEGVDPMEHRNAAKTRGNNMTFAACAEAYIEANRHGWKNGRQAEQWTNSLETYALPTIGKKDVRSITTAHVMDILKPIWTTKNETASRVRGRIESILSYARVSGYREGENPATWRGHLDNLLPKPSKVKKVRHHAALPYPELPAFFAALQNREGIAAVALQFTILTCARNTEVTQAIYPEFDLEAARWTIPAERMKAGRVHRVPLSAPALAIVREMPRLSRTETVFPNPSGEPLSENGMMSLLNRMGFGKYTVHGFRSTFRDWAAEMGNHPSELAEMALAHTIGDKVEAAYRRGDLFQKRVALADDWAAYCLSASSATTDTFPLTDRCA